jgi:hypothetical protein
MLRRFLRYLRKIFEFDQKVAVLRDHRICTVNPMLLTA